MKGKVVAAYSREKLLNKKGVHNYICKKLSLHFLRNFHLHSDFALLSHPQAPTIF